MSVFSVLDFHGSFWGGSPPKKLNLPPKKVNVAASTAESVNWNLNRMKGTHIHVCKRWDGAGTGGGCGTVRLQLIAACRDCFGSPFTDDQVIGMACDKSSYFFGLYNFIHCEIYTLAAIPFIQWQLGNIQPFLELLLSMTQLIATQPRKITIARCFLFELERVRFYAEKAPDVLGNMGASCTMLREDHIENHHSVLTHWVSKHVRLVKHRHYIRAAGLTWPAAATKRAMNKLLLNRRDAEQEEDIILQRTEKRAYAETNAQLDAWLLAAFLNILAGIKANTPWSPQYADSK
jgi:hypothetical protein